MPAHKTSRHGHEQEAIRLSGLAFRENVTARSGCGTQALYALVRGHRDVAHARSHLAGIGYHDSTRTRRLWAVVGRAEKAMDEASNVVARCLLAR
jgi:hypothetical protein